MRKSFSYALLLSATVGLSARADDSYFAPGFNDSVVATNGQEDAANDVQLSSCTDLVTSKTSDCDKDSCNGTPCGARGMKFLPSKSLCSNDSLFNNAQLFSGVEAYKGPFDTTLPIPPSGGGFLNSAGFVNGLNTSMKILDYKVRGQFGASIGIFDLRGRDVGNVRQQTEQQGFITSGIYKRGTSAACDPISWGVVYDQQYARQAGLSGIDYNVGQIRSLVGYALNDRNEIGFWGTARALDAPLGAGRGTLRAVNQYNLFVRHQFEFGGNGMLYAGAVDHISAGSWTAGSQFTAPMSKRVSLYSNSGFLFPSAPRGSVGADQLLWSVSGGLVFSFGGKNRSCSVTGVDTQPLLPVANNGTFMATSTLVGH